MCISERPTPRLTALLLDGEVCCHPFVIGELACGNLRNRDEVLVLLADLPQLLVAEHSEVMHLVNSRALQGKGLGWVDAHLLTSALLSNAQLRTLDRPLASVARSLGVAT